MIEIRALQTSDYEPLFKLIEANKERLRLSFPKTIASFEEADGARNFVKDRLQAMNSRESFYFLIFSEDVLVGAVSIKEIDWQLLKAELAYYIDRRYEGRGIITEALKWLVTYAHDEVGLKEVYVRVDPLNTGSKRVAIKNGFQFKSVVKNDFCNGNGEWKDVEYYTLIKK